MNRKLIAAIAPVVLFAAGTSLYAADAPPAIAPATQPTAADDQVRDLIKQLGNDDFHVREEAENKLAKMGRTALPALKEALKSEDPEIKSKAEAVIARIDAQDQAVAQLPNIRHGAIRIGQPIAIHNRISVTVVNGAKTVDAEENDRKVHITENADGIGMTVTETKDGKEVTREYKAKNQEEFKTNNPDVFPIYQRLAGGGGQGAQFQLQLNVGPGGNIGPVNVIPIQPNGVVEDAVVREQLDAQRKAVEIQRQAAELQLQQLELNTARLREQVQVQQQEIEQRNKQRQQELEKQAEPKPLPAN